MFNTDVMNMPYLSLFICYMCEIRKKITHVVIFFLISLFIYGNMCIFAAVMRISMFTYWRWRYLGLEKS